MTRLVDTVNIAECCGEQIPAADRIEPAGDIEGIVGGGVELGSRACPDAVFFSPNYAGLNLQDQFISPEALQ